MIRRSICSISILLLCVFVVSCSRTEGIEVDYLPEDDQEVVQKREPVEVRPKETEEVVQGVAAQEEAEEALEENDAFTEDILTQSGLLLSELIQEGADPDTIRGIINLYPAGTILETKGAKDEVVESLFYSADLSEDIKERIVGKSYGEECDIPVSELRYIRVLHRGFDGLTYIGELIVNQSIAEDIVAIFKELYEADYPVERMVLVDDYNADDIASMEANNTSAFNYRVIDNTTRLSLHSQGIAIDINPLYNPYIREIDGKIVVLPDKGTEYVDRSKECPYYIKEGDPCWLAFTERGFTWGGVWKNQKDFQHFQKKQGE